VDEKLISPQIFDDDDDDDYDDDDDDNYPLKSPVPATSDNDPTEGIILSSPLQQ
jgi:hypothetical protein